MKLLRSNLETLALMEDEQAFRKLVYDSWKEWINTHGPNDLKVLSTEMGVYDEKKS